MLKVLCSWKGSRVSSEGRVMVREEFYGGLPPWRYLHLLAAVLGFRFRRWIPTNSINQVIRWLEIRKWS